MKRLHSIVDNLGVVLFGKYARSTSQYYTACLHCGEKAKSGVMATDLDLIVPVQNNSDLADAFYEMQKSDTVSGVTCESAYVTVLGYQTCIAVDLINQGCRRF